MKRHSSFRTQLLGIASSILLAACAIASDGIKSADEIAASLEPTRSTRSVDRTEQFSRDAYEELNPGVRPESRGIMVMATAQGAQATVSVGSNTNVSFDNVRFKLNSVELADEASARQLMEIVKALKQFGSDRAFVIEGHTCDLGEEAYNQKLSEKRALVVGLFMRKQGVSCELVPLGFGERDRVTTETDEPSRQKNRRVVVRTKG